jgi:hypothetical protein
MNSWFYYEFMVHSKVLISANTADELKVDCGLGW